MGETALTGKEMAAGNELRRLAAHLSLLRRGETGEDKFSSPFAAPDIREMTRWSYGQRPPRQLRHKMLWNVSISKGLWRHWLDCETLR